MANEFVARKGIISSGSVTVTSGSFLFAPTVSASLFRGQQILVSSSDASPNIFGDSVLDQHIFSGSILTTGSLRVTGPSTVIGNQIISGSLTVVTGSGTELQVTNTGVTIGNISTDVHRVTGSLGISGSFTSIGNFSVTSIPTNAGYTSQLYSPVAGGPWILDTRNVVSSNDAGLRLIASTNSTGTESPAFMLHTSGSVGTTKIFLDNTSTLNFQVTGYDVMYLRKGDNRPGNVIFGGLTSDKTYNNASVLSRGRWDGAPAAVFAKRTNTTTADIIQVTDETLNNVYLSVSASGNVIVNNGTLFVDAVNNRVGINTTASLGAALQIQGSQIISGALTVVTGSGVEFQVTPTGIIVGNTGSDAHRVTGSLGVLGPVRVTSDTTASVNIFGGSLADVHIFSGSLVVTTGSARILGPFTVLPAGAQQFQVLNTGVTIGNTGTDRHTITGSLVLGGDIVISSSLTSDNIFGTNILDRHIFTGSVLVTGSVGIGTTNPTTLLHVEGVTPTITVRGTSTNSAKVNLAGPFTTWSLENQYVNGATNDMFRIYNSALSADAITINRLTNNVGMGTTIPSASLHVNRSSTSGITTLIENTQGSPLNNPVVRVSRLNNIFQGGTPTGSGLHIIEHSSNPALYIETHTNSPLLLVSGSGNVGIGTTTPTRRLEITTGDGTPQLRLSYAGGVSAMEILGNAASAGIINFGVVGGAINLGQIYYNLGNNSLSFFTNANQRVTIDSSGRMGIGTTAPSASLHVQGNISASSYTSSISNAVGFVGTASFAVSASWAPGVGTSGISSITAGDGLTGGTITSTGTITLDTSSVHFLDGVKKELNTEGVISSSTQFTSLTAPFTGSFTGSFTGQVTGTSSYAQNANLLDGLDSTIFATTGSNTFVGNQVVSGSITASSNGGGIQLIQNTAGSVFNGLQFTGYTGGSNGGLIWNQATGEIRLNAPASYFPTIYSSGTERLRIDTSGRVGIGTTAPSATLDVNGNQVISGSLTTTGSDATINTVRVGLGAGNITSNTTVGNNALLQNVSGIQNVAVGASALQNNTTGGTNVAVGQGALQANTIGASNVAVGRAAINVNPSGSQNIGIGRNTLFLNTTGSNNTVVGSFAMNALVDGSSNIIIGQGAGSSIVTGSNNTIIGTIAGQTSLSNTVIIGAGTTERLRIDSSGNVGIGLSSPSASLHVSGSTIINGAVTASTVLISGSGTQRLTVIGSGSAQPLFTVQGSQGELFSIVDSLSGSLFSVNDISGLPILEVFSDDTVLMGDYLAPALNTTKRLTLNTASNVIYSVPTASYDSIHIEYNVKSGSNGRAGNFVGTYVGSSVQFTDTSTLSVGSTTGVKFESFISGANLVVTGSVPTNGWTCKAIIRAI